MKEKTYFKVVTRNLTSAWIGRGSNSLVKDFVVQYKINEFVKPKVGQLMVFESLDDAKSWQENQGNVGLHIYECKVKNIVPRNKALFVHTYIPNIVAQLSKYLSLRKKHKSTANIARWPNAIPNGTVFCREVMLTKKIR